MSFLECKQGGQGIRISDLFAFLVRGELGPELLIERNEIFSITGRQLFFSGTSPFDCLLMTIISVVILFPFRIMPHVSGLLLQS